MFGFAPTLDLVKATPDSPVDARRTDANLSTSQVPTTAPPVTTAPSASDRSRVGAQAAEIIEMLKPMPAEIVPRQPPYGYFLCTWKGAYVASRSWTVRKPTLAIREILTLAWRYHAARTGQRIPR